MMQYTELPPDLPVPQDDGALAHLYGVALPELGLMSTDGQTIDLSRLQGLGVLYIYPMTGQPNVPLPPGWDDIPGARGCTPQSCSYRDHYQDILDAGASWVFGISVQTSDYQSEMATRLHLPFAVLSDADYALTTALRLPTFEVAGMRLQKRCTLIIRDGVIVDIHYPVFPSDQDPIWVLNKLNALSNRG